MTEHLAQAVEAAARMLPATIPDAGQYEVARAVINAALPHLEQHLGGRRLEELRESILAIHQPGVPDHDGMIVCLSDQERYPCPSARLCFGSTHRADSRTAD